MTKLTVCKIENEGNREPGGNRHNDAVLRLLFLSGDRTWNQKRIKSVPSQGEEGKEHQEAEEEENHQHRNCL